MNDKKWGKYIEIDDKAFNEWNKAQKINWKHLEVEYRIYIDGVLETDSYVGGGFVPERINLPNEVAIAINNAVLKEFDKEVLNG